jgi:hypothetical protein
MLGYTARSLEDAQRREAAAEPAEASRAMPTRGHGGSAAVSGWNRAGAVAGQGSECARLESNQRTCRIRAVLSTELRAFVNFSVS